MLSYFWGFVLFGSSVSLLICLELEAGFGLESEWNKSLDKSLLTLILSYENSYKLLTILYFQ